jgi:hypothetical protein
MRINHELVKKLQAPKEVKWLKHYHSGTSFKNLYKKNKRGEVVPSSYHSLFIAFLTLDIGNGANGKDLRFECGWRTGTHSDYFSLFTMNNVLTYNKSTKKYVKGENFDSYMELAKAKYASLGGK